MRRVTAVVGRAEHTQHPRLSSSARECGQSFFSSRTFAMLCRRPSGPRFTMKVWNPAGPRGYASWTVPSGSCQRIAGRPSDQAPARRQFQAAPPRASARIHCGMRTRPAAWSRAGLSRVSCRSAPQAAIKRSAQEKFATSLSGTKCEMPAKLQGIASTLYVIRWSRYRRWPCNGAPGRSARMFSRVLLRSSDNDIAPSAAVSGSKCIFACRMMSSCTLAQNPCLCGAPRREAAD